MKHFLLSVVLFFSISSVLAQETIHINWQPTLETAIKKSKEENKPILVYFTGSDWCGPCINLDRSLFHTEKFKKFSDENLVLYMADFPMNKDLVSKENREINKQLSEKYGQSSFPTILFIDDTGAEFGRKSGSYLPEYYFPFFEEIANQFK